MKEENVWRKKRDRAQKPEKDSKLVDNITEEALGGEKEKELVKKLVTDRGSTPSQHTQHRSSNFVNNDSSLKLSSFRVEGR